MVLTNDNGLHFLTTLANPFPNGVAEPVGAAAGPQTFLGQGFTFFNQNPKIPITIRWEASLQREFKSFLLEANYIGNKTNHLEVTRNINALPAAVPEHAHDARRHLQQPTDRQHRQPDVRPGPGQHPGHLHRHHHLAADAAFAVPGLRLQRHQQHREHRLLLVSQLPVHGLQALPEGLHRPGQLHLRRSGCRRSTC